MHRIAALHPNEEIDYDFYDDREDILDALKAFYTQYSHLIPSNVNLRLHHYAGAQDTLKAKIKGSPSTSNGSDCFIDSNYRETVKAMAKLTSKGPWLTHPTIDVAHDLNPSLLTTRKPLSQKPNITTKPIKVDGSSTLQDTPLTPEQIGQINSIHDFMKEMKNQYDINTRKQLSKQILPGRPHGFIVGMSSQTNTLYINDLFFSARADHQGNLFFATRDNKNSEWVPVSFEYMMATEGLFKQILERQKNPQKSISTQKRPTLFQPLTTQQKHEIELITEFVHTLVRAHNIVDHKKVCSINAGSLTGQTKPFKVTISFETKSPYLSNGEVSFRMVGANGFEFARKDSNEWVTIPASEALKSDLFRPIIAHQEAINNPPHLRVEQQEPEPELCRIS